MATMGYAAVADFVLQSETGEQIAETNNILSSWSPNGNQYFMIDYSKAESEAIVVTSL